jgi:DNA polymerase III subunit gamma/tau
MEKTSSYLVISRRYRPQKFEDLIGQEALGQTLKNAVLQNRSSHAYLFTGPRGVGKTSAARIMAKALRCESPDRSKIPCNECPSCREVIDGKSMDVIEIDAASNTGVDNIRELRDSVSYAAGSGKYRIFIIDEVHMLSTAAFNALLKTLEEPPPHVVFIFATTEIHKVPATILSRCQRFDFKRIPNEKIFSWLKEICKNENVQAQDDALHLITEEAEGCMRDAQSLLDQSIALSGSELNRDDLEKMLGFIPRKGFFELIRSLVAHNHGQALNLCSSALSGGADPKILLSRLVSVYRDLNFAKVANQYLTTDPDYKKLLQEAAAGLSLDEILVGLDQCLSLQSHLNSSIDAQIAVEALIVKLSVHRAGLQAESSQQLQNRSIQNQTTPPQTTRASTPQAPIHSAPTAQAPRAPVTQSPSPRTGSLIETFHDFLRRDRPAWLPVMKSIRSFEQKGTRVEVIAENDFAGKRLASNDGQAVLKQCFGTQLSFEVRLEGGSKEPKISPQEAAKQKLKEAKEDAAVQSALKAFKGKISETKIVEEDS